MRKMQVFSWRVLVIGILLLSVLSITALVLPEQEQVRKSVTCAIATTGNIIYRAPPSTIRDGQVITSNAEGDTFVYVIPQGVWCAQLREGL